MCIAVPARVESIDGSAAVVRFQNSRRQVLLMTAEARIGGWVLVYGGAAVGALSDQEAAETLALLARLQPKEQEY